MGTTWRNVTEQPLIRIIVLGAVLLGMFLLISNLNFLSFVSTGAHGTIHDSATDAANRYHNGVLTHTTTLTSPAVLEFSDTTYENRDQFKIKIQVRNPAFRTTDAQLCQNAFNGDLFTTDTGVSKCRLDYGRLAQYPAQTNVSYRFTGDSKRPLDGEGSSPVIDTGGDTAQLVYVVRVKKAALPVVTIPDPDKYWEDTYVTEIDGGQLSVKFDIDADQDQVYTVNDACPQTPGAGSDGCPATQSQEPAPGDDTGDEITDPEGTGDDQLTGIDKWVYTNMIKPILQFLGIK